VNATPVFADIDPKSWCISAKSFEVALPRYKSRHSSRSIWQYPDMDALREIAAKHNIAIIEDAAEAIGSTYKGKKAGSFGVTGVYSFHGSKTLTTGEGGILLTDRKDLYDRIPSCGSRPGTG
jgi:perosamine synthetase